MTLRILHSADWHLEGKGRFPGKEEGTIACLEYMLEQAVTLAPSAILISGDIFDKSKVWIERGVKEISVAHSLIERLSHIAPVVAIKGTPNHDGKEQFELLQEMLSNNDQVKLITEPELYNLQTKDGPLSIVGIPGLDHGSYRAINPGLSKGDENQALTNELMAIITELRSCCQTGQKSVLMAHYTTTEANTESGQMMMFSECEVILPKDQLQALNFDLIAMGHIHRPQQVAGSNIFYSGGINAFTFGDEDQYRGFYLHDLDALTADFHVTPYQQYQTLKFDDTAIEEFNNGDYSLLDMLDVADKVVRIYYEATQENINQFNATALEAELMQSARWVSEISCEKCLTLNRTTTMGVDPIVNIQEYFKDDDNLSDIMLLAQPIIDEKTITGNKAQGRIMPISIEVRNYRSYEKESYDFSNIDFATVIGENGAGKSAFFMDSIMDCLFEETRENDLKGWIRNSDGVKSGSITFCFSVGDSICRVVRTRAKSGKCTLSLCEFVDDEWIDSSGEKLKETQELIIQLVGDSLTLKSCALVMQDQYGIFLDVDRTERMRVLAGLLGLDLYEQAKDVFAEKATDTRRELNFQKKIKEDLIDIIRNGKYATADLAICKQQQSEKELEQITIEKEIKQIEDSKSLHNQLIDADKNKTVLENDLYGINTVMNQLNAEIHALSELLSHEQDIRKNAGDARNLETQIQGFAALERQHAEQHALNIKLNQQKATSALEIESLNEQIASTNMVLTQKDAITRKADTYAESRKQLDARLIIGENHIRMLNEQQKLNENYTLKTQAYEHEYNNRMDAYDRAKENHNLVESSGCKGSITCPFVDKAKSEGSNLASMRETTETWKAGELNTINALTNQLNQKSQAITDLHYDPLIVENLKSTVKEHQNAAQELAQLAIYEEKAIDLSVRIKNEQIKNDAIETELANNVISLNNLTTQLNQRSVLVNAFGQIKHYIDQEQLISGNKQVCALKTATLNEKSIEKDKCVTQLGQLDSTITALTKQLKAFIMQRSQSDAQIALKQIKEDIKALMHLDATLTIRREERVAKIAELKELQIIIKALSGQLVLLDQLKIACSYAGIPHLIIKDEIKIIENKANAILSQMSNGVMTVSFETEKVTKANGGKEVPVLDVLINDSNTGTLSYKSRSGGERVKVALASALALAELKATKTGVQMGFMFIDEPPFLDINGMEAYCDALETINRRYAGMKVLAITHDVSMQSRFMQSISIIKNDGISQIVA